MISDDGSPAPTEYLLDDDECPLSILMNHPPSRGTVTFHVRARPADFSAHSARRRKKKPSANVVSDSALLGGGGGHGNAVEQLPFFFEVNPDGSDIAPLAGGTY